MPLLDCLSRPMGGAIFETLVVTEIYKTILHPGQEPALYFWRTAAGAEVGLVVESEGSLIPFEIKAAATARPAVAKEIAVFQRFCIHSED
jgi:uncharacterized protein